MNITSLNLFFYNFYVSFLKFYVMSKSNVKAVKFDKFVGTVEFSESTKEVIVRRSHHLSDGSKVIQPSVVLNLTNIDFKTAMDVACALVSSIGLVEYSDEK